MNHIGKLYWTIGWLRGVHPDGTPVIPAERVVMGLAPYDLAELRAQKAAPGA